jgi:hypothetical protein
MPQLQQNFQSMLVPKNLSPKDNTLFGLAYQGKDIVFRFIIEYSGLRDFGP